MDLKNAENVDEKNAKGVKEFLRMVQQIVKKFFNTPLWKPGNAKLFRELKKT